MNKKQFVEELSKLRSSAMFLTLNGYRNEHSEVADYSIVFHMSYQSALERSVAILEEIVPKDDLQTLAKQELLDGYKASLNRIAETPIEENDDVYTHFLDSNNNFVKGIKLHTKTNTLHIYGSVVHKRVIMPGMYPTRNKKPLTLAKDKLRYMLPIGKFRQFRLLPSQVDSISVEKKELLPPV